MHRTPAILDARRSRVYEKPVFIRRVCPLFFPVADAPDDFIHGFEVRYVGLIFRAAAVKIAMTNPRSTLPFVDVCGMVAIFTRRHRSAHGYFRSVREYLARLFFGFRFDIAH
jgi:hypothetical protein